MTWLRIDDGMVMHAKVLPLSDGAFRAHVEALSHCARDLTDGRVALKVAKASRWFRRTGELVEAGLWDVDGDGWVIHDYLEYNPSRVQVEKERASKHEAKVRAGRVGGQRSGEARRKQTPSTDEADTQAKTKQNEAPSRPVPSRPDQTPTLRVLGLSAQQQEVADALEFQVHSLVFGGSGYTEPGWCEDLIRRGATLTDVDHAVQGAISRGKRSSAYVRAILEGRVKEREAGRDPDAERSPAPLADGAYPRASRPRAVASSGTSGDGARGGFSTLPPPA